MTDLSASTSSSPALPPGLAGPAPPALPPGRWTAACLGTMRVRTVDAAGQRLRNGEMYGPEILPRRTFDDFAQIDGTAQGKGLDYESVYVDLHKLEQHSDWFAAINPEVQVPVLDHDGAIITHTTVINEYLEYAFPNAQSACPAMAEAVKSEYRTAPGLRVWSGEVR